MPDRSTSGTRRARPEQPSSPRAAQERLSEKRDERAVRLQVALPELLGFHGEAPRPLHAGLLHEKRRTWNESGHDVEGAADAEHYRCREGFAVLFAPHFLERRRHADEEEI